MADPKRRTTVATVTDDGILSEPLDIDAPRRRGLARRDLFVELGMQLTHVGSGTSGAVVRFSEGQLVVLRDAAGRDHTWKPVDGFFAYQGTPVVLRAPAPKPMQVVAGTTASGSVDVGPLPARMARASRIWVEGIHDAELIERVWGDDLRYEGVVVEQLEGADDLAMRVRSFAPREGRRLGVLLDHLVPGSKESRIAAEVQDPNVLIVGHPYVDIWQAIKPTVAGIDAWPTVPMGQPWKQGIIAALGVKVDPPQFWKQLLGRVESWTDLETPLVTSVEQMIDFVTAT